MIEIRDLVRVYSLGEVEILVCNAGILRAGRIEELGGKGIRIMGFLTPAPPPVAERPR